MSRAFQCFAFLLLLLGPLFADAHATPIGTSPASGASMTEVQSLSITFSERIEEATSRLTVRGPEGERRLLVEVREDPRTLHAPFETSTPGIYVVSWSVISKDDGHFTKGSYSFSVGGAVDQGPIQAYGSEVVQITTLPEASAMFVEFLGNSLLWAALILFALVLRPLANGGKLASEDRSFALKWHARIVFFGALLAFSGGVAQILLKSTDLARLFESTVLASLPSYLDTAVGEATLFRAFAVLACGVIFFAFRKRIQSSQRFTLFEGALFGALLIFAYFRSIISHATANPFLPELSVAINFVHLIEKDLWAGILLILAALALVPSRRVLLLALIPRAFLILAADLALTMLTASYIVWLHLKSFANLTATLWGEVFVKLFASAVILVALRSYHTLTFRFAPRAFFKYLGATIPAEALAACLVLFFSSLIIITSPPLEPGPVLTVKDQGLVMTLARDLSEDSMLIFKTEGRAGGLPPTLTIGERNGGLLVQPTKRFEGGYAFPEALLTEGVRLFASVPQEGRYDAQGVFLVDPETFKVTPGERHLDTFTILMALIALCGLAYGILLSRAVPRNTNVTLTANRGHSVGVFLLITLTGVVFFAGSVHVFANDFKRACIASGDQWHLMLPLRSGVPTSLTPKEGCMLKDGQTHVVEPREYAYGYDVVDADVSLALPKTIVAGEETELKFSLLEKNGAPAELYRVHEKLIHAVIVSADMQDFMHVHPEDEPDFSDDNLNTGVFPLRVAFPRAGTYLVSIDYAHRYKSESRRFVVEVSGTPRQESSVTVFPSPFTAAGYEVTLRDSLPRARESAGLYLHFKKHGESVDDLTPYLAAAMHVAVVKHDLSEFIHGHGEVHPPGYVPTKNQLSNHVHALPPAFFGPDVETHLIFPSPGLYTVFCEFMHDGAVRVATFTVNVRN